MQMNILIWIDKIAGEELLTFFLGYPSFTETINIPLFF